MSKKFYKKTKSITAWLLATQLLICHPEQSFAKSLEISDIHKTMNEVLKASSNQKELSDEIIRKAIKLYIDQFDPEKIYLLQTEAAPYLSLNEEQLKTIVIDYKQNDYAVFNSLNKLFLEAIQRARQIREKIEKQPGLAMEPFSFNKGDNDSKKTFPANLLDLQAQNKKIILQYIAVEKRRYGDKKVEESLPATIKKLENILKQHEQQYMGDNTTAAGKENYYPIHILKALAGAIDAHTTILDDEEALNMRVRLKKSVQGVGLELRQNEEGAVLVSKLLPQGPADRSGKIQVNDKLININQEPVAGLTNNQIVEKLQGTPGSHVTVTFQRQEHKDGHMENRNFDVELVRENLTLNEGRVETSYERFGNGIIGIITLHSFYKSDKVSSEQDVREAISKLDQEGNLRGLILDLRDNGGGFLMEAVKVAGIFIKSGVVVISKYNNGEEHFYRDMDGKTFYNGPLVILVSKATASAAEIVTEALQDYGVAVVVGDERTYGKGTIQTQNVTGDNNTSSFLKVTVGEYYTVSGKTPQKVGVKSDVVVPGVYSSLPIGEELLENAMEPGAIPPSYNDTLQDIDPQLKAWYTRYYLPTLQQKQLEWKKMIPKLQKNSQYRIAHNKNYQAFLYRLNGKIPENFQPNDNNGEKSKLKEGIDEEVGALSQKDFGKEDIQMKEAVNVVKDMVILDEQNRKNVGFKAS